MGWFRRQKQQDGILALSAPDNNAWEDGLRARFAQAAFGRFFRTRSFKPPQGAAMDEGVDRLWREATYVPNHGWLLRNMHRYRGADGQILDKSSRIYPDRGVDFFEAVRILSIFEHTTESHSGIEAEPDEVKKLGHTHLRAFAEREGLVFDIHGMPHVTANGFIVTEGHFPPDAQAYSLEREEARVKALSALPTLTLPSLAQADDVDKAIFVRSVQINAAVNLLGNLIELANVSYTHQWIRYDRLKDELQAPHFRKIFNKDRPVFVNQIRHAFSQFDDQGKRVAAQFEQAYDLVKMYGLVSIVNYIRRNLDSDSSFFTQKNLKEHLSDLQKNLSDLGLGHLSAEAVALKLNNKSGVYSQELEDIRIWVSESTRLLTSREIVAENRASLPPPPLPSAF